MSHNNDTFWISWNGPEDSFPEEQYFAVSPQSGPYWTEDTSDPNIVDGSELDIIYTKEDTINQIAEKWRLHKGRQFERFNLFKHPNEHAWLACEKKPTGEKDEDSGKPLKEYKAFWTRKFKSVVAMSRSTGKRQGNSGFQNKEYARRTSAKARAERKKRLENIEKASKRLQFNPAEQLIAWAQGDEEKLNTKQPITNAQRIKCLEILASYSWAKPKPIDHAAIERNKQKDNQPTVHVVALPSNSRELQQHVVSHESQDSLDNYFKEAYKEPDEVEQVSNEAGDYDEETGFFIPKNGR